ncbi:hypothetical protein GVY41_15775 [Frigidibacter albus]|uniref:Uncharacterized protein n=1 Tax=Frigidibacter albus TaxID=1465486 RepID=A0A6L8VMP9_9RHOB|nr:hypothetical protein [Frigidibacter albus]MZQ90420.1 hypothetical protein [Frigidibacter albus]NBE32460.1 hypothetical protein [Frigidibacter albus]GGH59862.1 hypothetical protein GCM10011341_31570 [Frigidibacter albus]
MPLPALRVLANEIAYRQHFIDQYVQAKVVTRDGIRVHFAEHNFDHAFFESTMRDGSKDTFSTIRAQRIDWISATLLEPSADWYQGYVKQRKAYDPARSVTVAYGDFVVVLGFGVRKDKSMKANFITCYEADNSIGKIRTSPAWTLAGCRIALGV